MSSQPAFHNELARDRQQQLYRSARLDERTAPHVSELRAGERAELAAERRRALRYEPVRHSAFAAIGRRLRATLPVHPHGV
jgi:hypothetical protein